VAGLDDQRLTTVGLFLEAYDGVAVALERGLEDDCGLSRQWFEIMLRLARSPGRRLRMCDLAAQTGLSPSGLTRAVDRLVAEGLLVRSSCPSDRRVAYAELTAAGVDRIERAVDVHLDHIDRYFVAHLNRRDLDELERITRKLRDRLRPEAAAMAAVVER
jgi:DNA-binding MarR family transcriptional regulator